MSGIASNMSDLRYGHDRYGFPVKVTNYLKSWFDDDESLTPDLWGRKVVSTNSSGNRIPKILRHMKAGNRDKNQALFVMLSGREYLALCTAS